MKYFHSLIITGFLIPLLPLSAETALAEKPDAKFIEQREDASLTSLDEELSLLDEEFEEFKEELYSLENDLQKREKSSPSQSDNLLKIEKSQEEAIAIEEKNNSQIDCIAYETLLPEIDTQDQISREIELPILEKNELQHQTAAEPEHVGDLNQTASESELLPDRAQSHPFRDELAELSVFSNVEERLPLTDEESPPFQGGVLQITEPVKQVATDTEKFSPVEKLSQETHADTAIMLTSEPSSHSALIGKTELMEEPKTSSPQTARSQEKLDRDTPAILNVQGTSLIGEPMPLDKDVIIVDLKQAFSGSPIIYSLLFAMSVIAVGIWLYSILSLRSSSRVSPTFIKNLQNKLNSNHFEEALSLCGERDNLLCKMVTSGIHSRRHGLPVMLEAMKAEGRRSSIAFWQKIGLLNDIAIIAPMLGLLGTVLGMFYAFYDVNRSIESISTLFDGLGISVGTTVAGLVVAILALILHSTAKYRLVRALALVENEAQGVATLMDDRTSINKGS